MNPNSAILWLPQLIRNEPMPGGVRVPKTIMVKYDYMEALSFVDNNCIPEDHPLFVQMKAASDEIGYPVFIRSDLTSAKHNGPGHYRASSAADLGSVIVNTIEDNDMKFFNHPQKPIVLMVREWIDVDAPFEAFDGHPIGREWRFFANKDEVQCYHPYWPHDAIVGAPEGWREMLLDLHKEPECIEDLKRSAIVAAGLYGVSASVDFLMDKSGQWWLIDMATAKDSYHWPDCRYNKK